MESVVEICGLTRAFRRTLALDNVTLAVPRGGVFGLVGENGAGKTTLILHILGLLRAQVGSVRVFGMDPVRHPAEVLGRIGTLSEERDMPPWMRVDELIRYTRAFYPKWDPAYAEELRRIFDLDPKARLDSLSQGQLAKAGLLVALAHRPEFLVLDEPSSGLDPIVRRDILEAIILTVSEEGRTVLFSSHLLDEVERVADRVAMIHHGKVVLNDTMEDIKESHYRIVVRAARDREDLPEIAGALSCHGSGSEWTVMSCASLEEIKASAFRGGTQVVNITKPSLNEIFVSRAGENQGMNMLSQRGSAV
jgi:ABC-2 type transport system ATP-binding protein